MPTLRGITVALHSQYDARVVPESPLLLKGERDGTNDGQKDGYNDGQNDRQNNGLGAEAGVGIEGEGDPAAAESLKGNEERERDGASTTAAGAARAVGVAETAESGSVVAVRIPVCTGSQFWLRYRCCGPLPAPTNPVDRSFRFWYCKLFVGTGQCLVSWGVGEREQWSGKTVFALFDGGKIGVVEKRGFFFPAAREGGGGGVDMGEPMLEVRVYRSHARKMVRSVGGLGVGRFEGAGFRGAVVDIPTIGRLEKGDPGRRYTYALLDQVDEPYVVFRYYAQATTSRSYSPLQGLTCPETEDVPATSAMRSTLEDAIDEAPGVLRRRLSVPPRGLLALRPTSKRTELAAPAKKYAHRKHPEDPLDEDSAGDQPGDWGIKTPSPVKADRMRFERAVTPPSARAKNGSISLLRGVIANALRRREGSGSSVGGGV